MRAHCDTLESSDTHARFHDATCNILETRATVVRPDRTVGRIEEFEAITPFPLALYGDGKLLLRVRPSGLVRAAPDRTTINSVAAVPGTGTVSAAKKDGTVLGIRLPISALPVQAVSAHGERIGTLSAVFEGSPANVMQFCGRSLGAGNVPCLLMRAVL